MHLSYLFKRYLAIDTVLQSGHSRLKSMTGSLATAPAVPEMAKARSYVQRRWC